DSTANYTETLIVKDIMSHQYDLQFLIYSVATRRYLHTKIPDYNAEEHFGGVYYFYMRGMREHEAQSGVFFDMPSNDILQALDDVFANATNANATDLL
ncbi:MAG: hypothetical protein WA981_07560, partial [Glaciecola sp.]